MICLETSKLNVLNKDGNLNNSLSFKEEYDAF